MHLARSWHTAHIGGIVTADDGGEPAQTYPFDVTWRFRTERGHTGPPVKPLLAMSGRLGGRKLMLRVWVGTEAVGRTLRVVLQQRRRERWVRFGRVRSVNLTRRTSRLKLRAGGRRPVRVVAKLPRFVDEYHTPYRRATERLVMGQLRR